MGVGVVGWGGGCSGESVYLTTSTFFIMKAGDRDDYSADYDPQSQSGH